MSNKIEFRWKAIRNIVLGILFLSAVSFGGGYSLGASSNHEDGVMVAESDDGDVLEEIHWLLETVPDQLPRVIPPSQAAPREPTTSPVTPPVASTVQTPLPQADASQPPLISEENLLKQCQEEISCKVLSEEWERTGFKPSPKLITEKVTLTESARAQCEGVLMRAAKTNRAAAKKLKCIRTRHREAQCALLGWNQQEELPRDANGNRIVRSVVALKLLVDIYLNGVKNSNQISLCFFDISEQYTKWAVREAKAYQREQDDMPARQTELDSVFCAEQKRDLRGLLFHDIAGAEALVEFPFPLYPAEAMTQNVMSKVCLSDGGAGISAAQ